METHTGQITYVQDDVSDQLILAVAKGAIGALCPVIEAVILETKHYGSGKMRVSLGFQFDSQNANEARRTLAVGYSAIKPLIGKHSFAYLDKEMAVA